MTITVVLTPPLTPSAVKKWSDIEGWSPLRGTIY